MGSRLGGKNGGSVREGNSIELWEVGGCGVGEIIGIEVIGVVLGEGTSEAVSVGVVVGRFNLEEWDIGRTVKSNFFLKRHSNPQMN